MPGWDLFRDLVDRVQHERTRADELVELRRRFRSATPPEDLTDEERALAQELRERRQAVLDALGEVQSCRGCARGHPLPNGRWSGGHCCGGRTEGVFSDEEVEALQAGGTRPGDLRAPRGDHAGCAFRGETGCSLQVVNRPSICVRYLCRDLMGELARRGDLRKVMALCVALDATFGRFNALREANRRKLGAEFLRDRLI